MKSYSRDWGREVLSNCCQFNAFLIERGLTESLVEPFFDVYLVNIRTAVTYYSPRIVTRGVSKLLLRFIVETKAVTPTKPARVRKPHDWLLHPYLQHLQDERGFSVVTLQRVRAQMGSFLDALGRAARNHRFKVLRTDFFCIARPGFSYSPTPDSLGPDQLRTPSPRQPLRAGPDLCSCCHRIYPGSGCDTN